MLNFHFKSTRIPPKVALGAIIGTATTNSYTVGGCRCCGWQPDLESSLICYSIRLVINLCLVVLRLLQLRFGLNANVLS